MRVCKISFLESSFRTRPAVQLEKLKEAWSEQSRHGQEHEQLQTSSKVLHSDKRAWFSSSITIL